VAPAVVVAVVLWLVVMREGRMSIHTSCGCSALSQTKWLWLRQVLCVHACVCVCRWCCCSVSWVRRWQSCRPTGRGWQKCRPYRCVCVGGGAVGAAISIVLRCVLCLCIKHEQHLHHLLCDPAVLVKANASWNRYSPSQCPCSRSQPAITHSDPKPTMACCVCTLCAGAD
jgi:hypothetical protein